MLTPSNFQRSAGSRWSDYDLLQRKPVSSFGGPQLEKISFDMILDISFGVNPQSQLQILRDIRDTGEVHPLVINDKMITDNYWRLDDLKESDLFFTNEGQIYHAVASVQLVEYSLTNYVENTFKILDILRWLK